MAVNDNENPFSSIGEEDEPSFFAGFTKSSQEGIRFAPQKPVEEVITPPSRPGLMRPGTVPSKTVESIDSVNNRFAKQENTIYKITVDQLVNAEKDIFEGLQNTIATTIEWIQERLKESENSDLIHMARSKRGEAYNEAAQVLDKMILQYNASGASTVRGDKKRLVSAAVINEIIGLGPIEPFWDDPSISEIMVNGPDDIQIERHGRIVRVPGAKFRDQDHLLNTCRQILNTIGRRIDSQNPIENGRLPDLSRIHVVHQDIAPSGPNLTIRRHPDSVWTIRKLVEAGAMNSDIARLLAKMVYARCNIVVVGGTGTGKTSMLNALTGLISLDERIVSIEDNLELHIHPNRLAAAPMEARPAAANSSGAVTIRDLVKASLRMRPDRIIVGEVRDATAFDMLQAMNTGHDGSMTTIHANDAETFVERLETLIAQAGEVDPRGIPALIAGSLDLIVVVTRFPEDRSRRITGIWEIPSRVVMSEGNTPTVHPVPLWEFVYEGQDSDGKVIGHYEDKNPPSEALVRKKRLNHIPDISIEDIYEFSDVPE